MNIYKKDLDYTQPIIICILLLIMVSSVYSQQNRDMQYFRYPDKRGINVFEAPKTTDIQFDELKVRIGGSNTLQFQALTNDDVGPDLDPNFNLATSNLDLDVQVYDGMRLHLRTYLSSRHHSEAWVKGGYLQIDKLTFLGEDFMAGTMENLTIKVGHMEINYGDAHFRRSDNGQAIFNPFVGNYIMDSFTTEIGGELYYQNQGGFLGMVGLSNGKLNQSTVSPAVDTRPAIMGKIGYDSGYDPFMRGRLTVSTYSASQAASIYLYSGDRAGGRYYNVADATDFSGRFSPDFTISGMAPGGPAGGSMTALMINPFVKFLGLEFFGMYENVRGKNETEEDNRTFNQYGAELLYRFGVGADDNLYLGGRYNLVTGDRANNDEIEISRINLGGGWFLTRNVLTKIEYVTQSYDGFTGDLEGAGFNGFMMEAVISF
ncbi:MAG: hypothetical protein WD267_02210 [Balneolales bacterium]